MKFNMNLNSAPDIQESPRHDLTADEIFYYKLIFKEFAEVSDNIPDHVFKDMADIQSQFEKDWKMSDKQIKYVEDVYEKYC